MVAGLIYTRYPEPSVVLGFACGEHADHFELARALTGQDRAELAARRARWSATVVDKEPWEPERPFATGTQARLLLARARRWTKRRETEEDPPAARSAGEPD